MFPIKSGAKVTVVPAQTYEKVLKAGDIVLCRVRGHDYLHLVKAVKGPVTSPQYLIGNNRGGLNGWIPYTQIYGVCTQVEN